MPSVRDYITKLFDFRRNYEKKPINEVIQYLEEINSKLYEDGLDNKYKILETAFQKESDETKKVALSAAMKEIEALKIESKAFLTYYVDKAAVVILAQVKTGKLQPEDLKALMNSNLRSGVLKRIAKYNDQKNIAIFKNHLRLIGARESTIAELDRYIEELSTLSSKDEDKDSVDWEKAPTDTWEDPSKNSWVKTSITSTTAGGPFRKTTKPKPTSSAVTPTNTGIGARKLVSGSPFNQPGGPSIPIQRPGSTATSSTSTRRQPPAPPPRSKAMDDALNQTAPDTGARDPNAASRKPTLQRTTRMKNLGGIDKTAESARTTLPPDTQNDLNTLDDIINAYGGTSPDDFVPLDETPTNITTSNDSTQSTQNDEDFSEFDAIEAETNAALRDLENLDLSEGSTQDPSSASNSATSSPRDGLPPLDPSEVSSSASGSPRKEEPPERQMRLLKIVKEQTSTTKEEGREVRHLTDDEVNDLISPIMINDIFNPLTYHGRIGVVLDNFSAVNTALNHNTMISSETYLNSFDIMIGKFKSLVSGIEIIQPKENKKIFGFFSKQTSVTDTVSTDGNIQYLLRMKQILVDEMLTDFTKNAVKIDLADDFLMSLTQEYTKIITDINKRLESRGHTPEKDETVKTISKLEQFTQEKRARSASEAAERISNAQDDNEINFDNELESFINFHHALLAIEILSQTNGRNEELDDWNNIPSVLSGFIISINQFVQHYKHGQPLSKENIMEVYHKMYSDLKSVQEYDHIVKGFMSKFDQATTTRPECFPVAEKREIQETLLWADFAENRNKPKQLNTKTLLPNLDRLCKAFNNQGPTHEASNGKSFT